MQQAATLLVMAFLATVLSPEDFGLVGMVMVLAGLANVLADTGFSAAVIQDQRLGQRHYATLFWVNLAVGSAVSVFFFFSASLIAAFYQREELVLISQVLACSFFLSSLSTLPQAILRKNMSFKELSIADTVVYLLTGSIVVAMAWGGAGIWSLVLQPIIQQLLKALILWPLSGWRPSFILSWSALKDVYRFSFSILGLQYLQYLMANLDYLLIGRFLGAEALGIYTLAYKVMFVPIRNICLEVVKVLFSAFSKIQAEKDQFRALYLDSMRMTALIVMPMLTGMFLVADPFVVTVFGPQWEMAVPVLKVLCLVGLVQSVVAHSGVVFRALGFPGLELKINIVRFFVTLGVLLWALQFGLLVFTWALFGLSTLFMLVQQSMVKRFLDYRHVDWLMALQPPFLLSLMMAILLMVLQGIWPMASWGHLQRLLVLVAVGVGFYSIGVGVWWRVRRQAAVSS
ncbi:lipopolysaccharide biosynthesis protein [Ferrimonas gelatinilytica]|uniref:Lipopolysaccharide biosynthesis protein n=1 Tax=Ferrimonas gelatinilytica TaxID=1255257 RepID=A0ABP9SCK4_9GAMM